MRPSYRVFWLPKSGCSLEEYEDAFAPAEIAQKDLKEFRCAIADGATETSFSGLWAGILCRGFVDKKEELHVLQEEWRAQVSGKDLPWYAEEKLESGAYAAFLSFEIKEEKKSINWTARALGDTCLFHLRDGKILESLPLSSWEDFDYRPLLLSTRDQANKGVLEKLVEKHGTARKGDLFYLMTDAISKWFLRSQSEAENPIAILESLNTIEEFLALVDSKRHEKDDEGRVKMPNDDVSWIRIGL